MSSKSDILFSIVMPCFNEGVAAKNMLEETYGVLVQQLKVPFEIIIVNDGSTDDTLEYLQEAEANIPAVRVISYTQNKGKGFAVKKGVNAALGEVVGFIDADLEIPPLLLVSYYNKLIQDNLDIVVGSKWHPKSIANRSWKRKALSRLSNKMIEVLFQLKGIDTQVGLKVFKKEVAVQALSKIKTNGFAFDIEFLVQARKKGFSISSAPIYIQQHGNASNVRATSVVKTFLDTMKLHHQMKKHVQPHSKGFQFVRMFLLATLLIPLEFIFETLVEV